MAIKVFAHGDYVTAAQMNEYKTVLDAAKAALNAGSPALPMQVAAEHASSGEFWVWHVYRYLHYGSNGALVDQNGTYPDVSGPGITRLVAVRACVQSHGRNVVSRGLGAVNHA